MKKTVLISATSLILVNCFTIFAVFFLGWNIFNIFLVYLVESAIIGLYTIMKLVKKSKEEKIRGGKVSKFIFTYYFSLLVYLIFILLIASLSNGGILSGDLFPNKSFFILVSFGLFISHSISFILNFLGEKEYQRKKFEEIEGNAYIRIIPIHIAIVLGFFILRNSLIVLVVIKTIIDLGSHLNERRIK